MEPQKHYTPKDFKRYARKEFPNEFALFRELYVGDFEHKTYLDANHAAHNISVLLVGRYHTRKGGPSVWAQATATGVRYFSGKTTEAVCTPVPEEHVTRIYYSEPYSSIIGTQESRSRTAGRKAGQYFIETIINVLFLLTGRLEQVSNPSKTDMLSNFRYVCLNSKPASHIQEVGPPAALQQYELPPTHDPIERAHKKRKRTSDEHGQHIKHEEDDSDIVSFGSSSMDNTHRTIQSRPASQTPRTSLFDQLRNYETSMATKLEREKAARIEEVRTLKAKLEEQELKIQAAEEKATCEKKKRKRIEEQMQALRNQTATQNEEQEEREVDDTPCDGGTRSHKRRARRKKAIGHMEKALEDRNKTIRDLRKALEKNH